jgi:dTDP-glucose pyrophosphorylase
MKFKKLVINENANILEALSKLNLIRDVSKLVLFVEDNNNKIIGSLSDGDIRRSLIINKDLNKKIGSICNRDFVHKNASNEITGLNEILNKNIKILPILTKEKKLEKILDLEISNAVLPMECVIMAGGRGKRLSPLTDNVPKPMLKINGKPIIEHTIDNLKSFGIKKFYISVNYLKDQIINYFGDGSSKEIEIEYINEESPLGTAGSLSLIKKIDTELLLLINGDVLTNLNFEKMFLNIKASNSSMIVASKEYKVDIPYAIFEESNKKVFSFKEKPSYLYYSNAGIYIFKSNLIKNIPYNTFYNITDLMENIVDEKKLIHFPIRGYWMDIGSPVDFNRAKDFLKYID